MAIFSDILAFSSALSVPENQTAIRKSCAQFLCASYRPFIPYHMQKFSDILDPFTPVLPIGPQVLLSFPISLGTSKKSISLNPKAIQFAHSRNLYPYQKCFYDFFFTCC
jgi:hypothetical protein